MSVLLLWKIRPEVWHPGLRIKGALARLSRSRRKNTISAQADVANNVIGSFQPGDPICDIEGGEAELIPAFDCRGLRAVVIERHQHLLTGSKTADVSEAFSRQTLFTTPIGPVVQSRYLSVEPNP